MTGDGKTLSNSVPTSPPFALRYSGETAFAYFTFPLSFLPSLGHSRLWFKDNQGYTLLPSFRFYDWVSGGRYRKPFPLLPPPFFFWWRCLSWMKRGSAFAFTPSPSLPCILGQTRSFPSLFFPLFFFRSSQKVTPALLLSGALIKEQGEDVSFPFSSPFFPLSTRHRGKISDSSFFPSR